jgi:GTP-binding protein
LAKKTRWLVINKIDLLASDDLAVAREMLLQQLQWDGPVFEVSAVTGAGTDELGNAVMQELERLEELAALEAT